MTNEQRIETAADLKASGKCNCTQAVLKVFEDKIPIDDEKLMQLSSGFAAGMGGMESTCGALIGAIIVAGFLKEKMSSGISRKIVKKFAEKSGATICKDLKGLETGKVLCECPDCVRNAISAMYEVLEKSE